MGGVIVYVFVMWVSVVRSRYPAPPDTNDIEIRWTRYVQYPGGGFSSSHLSNGGPGRYNRFMSLLISYLLES